MMFSKLASIKSIFNKKQSPRGKFLLVKPPHEYFPIGLSYVAYTLEEAGFAYDYIEWNETQDLEFLKKGEYYGVGTGGLVADYFFIEKLFKIIKQINPNICTVLGGHVARDVSAETLFNNSLVDVIVIGEAEITLPELLNALLSKDSDLSKIKGIAYRISDKEFKVNEKRARVELKNHKTMPSFKFFDYHKWPKEKTIPIITGRGCSGRCTFCSPSHYGFLSRPFDELFEEIDYYINELNRTHLTFINEVLYQSEDEIIEFCEKFKARFPGITFDAVLRMDVDPMVLRHLADAGCRNINVGVETGTDKILKVMCKMITVEKIRAFVQAAKEAGIVLNSGFLLNNETETESDIDKTIDFHNELKIVSGLGFTIPYPGTTIFKRAVRKGLISDEYQFLKDLHICYKHDFLTEMLFLHKPNGKPLLPNITSLDDDSFVNALRRGYLRFNAQYAIKNMTYAISDHRIIINGNCPICGTAICAEQSLDTPFTRAILCPNRATMKCYSLFLHAHVFLFEEANAHAQKISSSLANKQRIGVYGSAYSTKFLLDHDIFGVHLSQITGVLDPYPQLEGQCVFEDKFGNSTPNTRALSLQDFVNRDFDAVIITEMHPYVSRIMHDTLTQLGIPASNIYTMLPEGIIPHVENHEYWRPVRRLHSHAKVLAWSFSDLFMKFVNESLISLDNVKQVISRNNLRKTDLKLDFVESIESADVDSFDTICIFDSSNQGDILKLIARNPRLAEKNIFIAHSELSIFMYISGNNFPMLCSTD